MLINAFDYGASGSEYSTVGTVQSGDTRISVQNIGDFRVGQSIYADGCFYHTNGVIYNDKEPYYARNQRPLQDEIEIEGLEPNVSHQVFLIHFYSEKSYSWMSVTQKYQTKITTWPGFHHPWVWQGQNLPVNGDWQELCDGVKFRFRKMDWKKGETISFHVSHGRVVKILAIANSEMTIGVPADISCDHIRIRHHDNEALQNALDAAVQQKKRLFIPAGRYYLDQGLWLKHASAVIEGESRNSTILDVSEAHTACFWIAGGKNVAIRNLCMNGHCGFMKMPQCAWQTATGFAFWPLANQQMEVNGCSAINAVSTEHLLFEDLDIMHMASEAIYLHGSDRNGDPPYIQAPHEGIEGLDKQYQKTCVIHRCNGYDCTFNLFNNNDFAEDTLISECRAENVGNFCENGAKFCRYTNNHIINGNCFSICGKGNAIISGNIIESGSVGCGISISAGFTIVENNIIRHCSKECPIKIRSNDPVIFRGNIIDMTLQQGNPDHLREGALIAGQNVIFSDNVLIGNNSKMEDSGILISGKAKRVNIYNNTISGFQNGIRFADRLWNEKLQQWEWKNGSPDQMEEIHIHNNQINDCNHDVS